MLVHVRGYFAHTWDRIRGFLVRRWGPLPIIGLALALLFFLIALAFESWVASLWSDLQTGIGALLRQPVGVWGMAVLVLLAGMILISFLDTSPTAQVLATWLTRHQQVKRPPIFLSQDEKDAIAKMRHLWSKEAGGLSWDNLHTLLNECINSLTKKQHLAILLRPKYDHLRATGDALNSALDITRPTPLAAVVDCFNAFYKAYLDAAALMYLAHDSGDLDFSDEHLLRSLNRFREGEKHFREELDRVTAYPGLHGRLKIFLADETWGIACTRFLGMRPWGSSAPPGLDGV